MKVLAFAASNNKNSINKQLALYVAKKLPQAEVRSLNIHDFEMPIFSDDREKEHGIPQLAHNFYQAIGDADVIVVSFAEHNGTYTAAYKNVFDWTSRIDMKVFQNKPVIMLSTSPGQGGAQSVLKAATESAPYFAANVKGALSLPSFFDNFDTTTEQVTCEAFNQKLASAIGGL